MHGPRVGKEDAFEQEYRREFLARITRLGQIVEYLGDRATLDCGLHLYERAAPERDLRLSQVRVWFQLKGIHATTFSPEAFGASETVPVADLPVDHVWFWYGAPEPVYLGVYIEAADEYLVADVREVVDRQGGAQMLGEKREAGQATITLHVSKEHTLARATQTFPRRASLRLDGPDFRGRPLGHRMDPLRSELLTLSPDDFEALVLRLLDAHDFRGSIGINLEQMLDPRVGRVRALVGTLYLTYEWTSPLFTEFGSGPESDFRIESPSERAQGKVLIVIHSEPAGTPEASDEISELVRALRGDEVSRALVFLNRTELGDSALWGAWRGLFAELHALPQGLGSLAFNVLTATTIYLEFLDRLRWRIANYR